MKRNLNCDESFSSKIFARVDFPEAGNPINTINTGGVSLGDAVGFNSELREGVIEGDIFALSFLWGFFLFNPFLEIFNEFRLLFSRKFFDFIFSFHGITPGSMGFKINKFQITTMGISSALPSAMLFYANHEIIGGTRIKTRSAIFIQTP